MNGARCQSGGIVGGQITPRTTVHIKVPQILRPADSPFQVIRTRIPKTYCTPYFLRRQKEKVAELIGAFALSRHYAGPYLKVSKNTVIIATDTYLRHFQNFSDRIMRDI